MFFDLAPLALAATVATAAPRIEPIEIRSYVAKQAALYGFTADDIRGPSLRREHVLARAAIARELKAYGYSLPGIGRALNRHHTSILSLLRRYGR